MTSIFSVLSAKFKLLGEDAARQRFKESDLAMIEGDTPERVEADPRVIERYERDNGIAHYTASYAARAKARLKSMTRIVLDR